MIILKLFDLKNLLLFSTRLRHGEALKLGDLSGNRFTIIIRQVSESNDEIIRQGLDHLSCNGFINYFGLQRFGSCAEAPTHSIGKYLIQSKIKEAIELIMQPRSDCN